MTKKKKILLAFSGGLDTSFCAVYLAKEQNYEVYSAIVNTGGFSEEELQHIESHAKKLGVHSHIVLNVTQNYYDKCIKYMIFGNSLRNRSYPMSVSSERSFQALALAEYAKENDFKEIAHGSTAAGNDQIRFDLTIQVLAPEIKVITPIRDLSISRDEEISFLAKNGIQMTAKEIEYSINQGLWGTSVGGKETLTSNKELPESAFPSGEPGNNTEIIEIEFEKGEPIAINGERLKAIDLITKLTTLGESYAIGRDVHVGDTIIGIKGRVGFEAAAAQIIIEAHLSLEKHVLTRWQLHWKEQIGSWYGMFVHEAQFLDPVMRNLEAFLDSSQSNVSGKVSVRLRPYSFVVTGISSPYDLMDADFAAYGEENRSWTSDDVNGFTKIISMQQKLWYLKNT